MKDDGLPSEMHKGKASDMLTEMKDKVHSIFSFAFGLTVLMLFELAYMAIDAYEKSRQRRHKH